MQLTRRMFFLAGGSALVAAPSLTSKERVDRVLAGKEPDRPPFSLWHHFGLESKGAAAHAKATLDFHDHYGTDLVKVMSDFPYPKPSGAWWDLRAVDSPFPDQLRALDLIRQGLAGKAHFVETLFNPWNVAEKLSSKEEVARLKTENPKRLHQALEAIARSEANHARLALKTGASGIFLAIANAQTGILTAEEYRNFSEPYDRMVLDAAKGAPLNVLHLHGDKVYVDHFLKGWDAAINYSVHETGVPISKVRQTYSGLLIGGLDQRNYRTRTVEQLRADIALARKQTGVRLIVTPGCSVPNESLPVELTRLKTAIAGAA